MELTPIKVKIVRHPSGRGAAYPSFNDLPARVRGDQDWAVFIDRHGGWHYDKKSRFGESDADNPDVDSQFGAVLVPEDFCDAAVAAWPGRVERMTETQFEAFYNDRAHDHEPDVVMDVEVMNQLRAKYGLAAGVKLTAGPGWDKADADALDPDNPTPGVKRNPSKTYARFKAKRGVTIKPRVGVALEVGRR